MVCRHLTAPHSFTNAHCNVERLLSYGGLVATDHCANLCDEKLGQVLFLRENALMANFELGWLMKRKKIKKVMIVIMVKLSLRKFLMMVKTSLKKF